jgi:large subunit ribosomal protein L29
MKYSEIAKLTDQELGNTLTVEKDALSKLKFAHAISPIENPMKISSSRKLVARLNTEISKRLNK